MPKSPITRAPKMWAMMWGICIDSSMIWRWIFRSYGTSALLLDDERAVYAPFPRAAHTACFGSGFEVVFRDAEVCVHKS